MTQPLSPSAQKVQDALTALVIGGVPPLGHAELLETIIDESLMRFDSIWAAAGTPNAVFNLTPADLAAMTGGRVAVVS